MKKNQKKRPVPKVIELVSVLASYLDSEMDEGQDISMTPLAKQLELKGGSPHKNTVTDKLTEGFILRDILVNFEPTFENGELKRIRKLRPNEMKMKGIMSYLIQIKEDQEKIVKEITKIKKSTKK